MARLTNQLEDEKMKTVRLTNQLEYEKMALAAASAKRREQRAA